MHAQIDWQSHPAMHMTWPVLFGPGLRDRAPHRSARHQFHQVMYTPYVDGSGVRIHLWAAMAAERARSPRQARALILRQLRYVEDWVARNADRYALARSPAEAREILARTDKAVVIHAIEGGRYLLQQPGDAAFWRAQGVALVTVTHLLDDGLGGAALNEGLVGRLTNAAAARKRRRGEDRGLRPRGREVLVELADAGILVDLTHMSPQAVAESLEITRAHGIPPVVTHGKLAQLVTSERSFSDEQIVEIYRQGGVFNLVLSGTGLAPDVEGLVLPQGYCPGTLDAFGLHWQRLRALIDAHADEILAHAPDDGVAPQARLATGWAGDWNGWTRHSAPVYGPGRCRPLAARPEPALAVDTEGLAHPGMLPGHWQRLEEAGLDLAPMRDAAERFLQLWEQVDERR